MMNIFQMLAPGGDLYQLQVDSLLNPSAFWGDYNKLSPDQQHIADFIIELDAAHGCWRPPPRTELPVVDTPPVYLPAVDEVVVTPPPVWVDQPHVPVAPEPATWVLMLGGLVAIGWARWRRRNECQNTRGDPACAQSGG